MDPTRTQPTLASLMAGEFLVLTGGEGESYSAEQARDWLAATDWKAAGEVKPLVGAAGLLVAEAT